MLSPALERLVDDLAEELKAELPEAKQLSDFALRSKVLDAIRAHGNKLADELIEAKHTIDLAQAVIDLARLQA